MLQYLLYCGHLNPKCLRSMPVFRDLYLFVYLCVSIFLCFCLCVGPGPCACSMCLPITISLSLYPYIHLYLAKFQLEIHCVLKTRELWLKPLFPFCFLLKIFTTFLGAEKGLWPHDSLGLWAPAPTISSLIYGLCPNLTGFQLIFLSKVDSFL